MLSYLKGAPLDWFQTELINSSNSANPPLWFSSAALFITELRRLFGPCDPVADATVALEHLRYRDSGKAVKYTLDFNRNALKTGWNDVALTRQYYKGLPDRLKDELTRVGRPKTLAALQNAVQVLDQRYWERQNEISRDRRTATPAAFTRNPDKPPTSSSPSASSPNKPQPSARPQSKPQPNASSKPRIADKLGSDGKLKEEERKYRMANDLCLFCGLSGHKVRDCRKRAASEKQPAVKGRAAELSAIATDDESVKE
jgi:hypothetical protein